MVLLIITLIGGVKIYKKISIVKGLYGGREIINYNEQRAIGDGFYPDFKEAKYLGKTEEREFEVYAYGNKSDYKLFTLVGSDNTDSYRAYDYEIPTSGEITKIFIDPAIRNGENKVTKKQDDIEMFKKLTAYEGVESKYHINNKYIDGDEFYFAYDNCPVTTRKNMAGYVARVDNSWIIVKPQQYREKNESMDSNAVDLMGIKITDSNLIQWLNQYFGVE